MRSQIFVLPKQLFEMAMHPELQVTPPDAKCGPLDSGMELGFLINCKTDEETMQRCEIMAYMGHEFDVVVLKDDEPWPTVQARREAWLRANKV